MAFRSYDTIDNHQVDVYLGLIAGTHSSGKTTVINVLGDPGFEATHDLNDDPFEIMPTNHARVLSRDSPLVMVTTEEAARYYARHQAVMFGRENILTSNYTAEDQIMIEALGIGIIMGGLHLAAELAVRLDPQGERRQAWVLSDSSMLTGRAYSDLRLPERDLQRVDMAEVKLATIGFSSGSVPGNLVPIRKYHENFLQNYCDVVFMCDYREVPFENDGQRVNDLDLQADFRADVDHLINSHYAEILGHNRMVGLSGTVDERLHTVISTLLQISA